MMIRWPYALLLGVAVFVVLAVLYDNGWPLWPAQVALGLGLVVMAVGLYAKHGTVKGQRRSPD
jgi:hypothetical protein